MEKKIYIDMKTEKEAIETLKQLYIGMSEQKIRFEAKQEMNQYIFKQYQNQIQKMIEDMLNYVEMSDERKIGLLEIFIENLINEEINPSIREKMKNIYGEYYALLKKQIQEIQTDNKESKNQSNEENEENEESKAIRDEKKVLDLIRDSSVNIYEDKSEKEEYQYGEFIKEREKEAELIYRDEHMALITLETYQTQKIKKTKNPESRILASLEKKEVCQYEYQIEDQPNQRASIRFFASPELGRKIKRGNLRYISPMLAAILKAKEEGREYIGDISIMDKELNKAVTRYDNDLEMSVKKLKEKEKRESKLWHKEDHIEETK